MFAAEISPSKTLLPIRLRAITVANFNCSEVTMLEMAHKKKLVPPDMRPGDAIAFISMGRNQMRFIVGRKTIRVNGKPMRFTVSNKLRIEGGRWDPKMLASYSQDLGYELIGHRRFKDYYDKLVNS